MRVRAFNDESKSFVSAKLIELENMEIIDERGFDLSWFSGVKSRGIQLYQGDIIQSCFGIPPIPIKAAIEFVDGSFIVKTPKFNPTWCTLSDFIAHIGEVEVIGNVYQNPELIENNNK